MDVRERYRVALPCYLGLADKERKTMVKILYN